MPMTQGGVEFRALDSSALRALRTALPGGSLGWTGRGAAIQQGGGLWLGWAVGRRGSRPDPGARAGYDGWSRNGAGR